MTIYAFVHAGPYLYGWVLQKCIAIRPKRLEQPNALPSRIPFRRCLDFPCLALTMKFRNGRFRNRPFSTVPTGIVGTRRGTGSRSDRSPPASSTPRYPRAVRGGRGNVSMSSGRIRKEVRVGPSGQPRQHR